MSGYDTLLFIHVLAAFAIVSGLACVTPLVLGADVGERASARLILVSRSLFGFGGLGTLIFGLWLVANRDYRFFKFWVIGALVLWFVTAGAGNKISGPAERTLYTAAVAATVGILFLMTFKPGA